MNPLRLWIPCKNVGGIGFGQPKHEVVVQHKLRAIPDHTVEDLGWKQYVSPDGLEVFFENDIVVSISCFDDLIFNKTNIIGMSLNNVQSIFPTINFVIQDTLEVAGEDQTPVDSSELGLLLWLLKGKVVSACCSDGN